MPKTATNPKSRPREDPFSSARILPGPPGVGLPGRDPTTSPKNPQKWQNRRNPHREASPRDATPSCRHREASLPASKIQTARRGGPPASPPGGAGMARAARRPLPAPRPASPRSTRRPTSPPRSNRPRTSRPADPRSARRAAGLPASGPPSETTRSTTATTPSRAENRSCPPAQAELPAAIRRTPPPPHPLRIPDRNAPRCPSSSGFSGPTNAANDSRDATSGSG
mmetsp:Transcript_18555/g.42656  ORF Transcript_18555/g.42656 Transcript_18555/m.42656 type:complete len:225 (+) Transcript_18555:653-1327(+)